MRFDNDLVSVIMSAYNAEDSLEESVNSILEQSYKNIEFLIIDDCSKDNSKKILKSFEKKYQNIKIFENNVNIGLTASLNKLLKVANGKYIARQDADDISLYNRIETQLDILKKYSLDFCSTRATIIQNNKTIPRLAFYLPKKVVIKFKNPFIHGTLLIKSQVIQNIGMYDEKYYYAQDYKLMQDLIRNNYKYKIIKESLYMLNMENNISSTNKKDQQYFANQVRKNT